MDREAFESLVAEALDELPEEFQDSLENVAVVVKDWPTEEQLASLGMRNRLDLLGLYEGVPRVERDQGYNLVLPDKITLFRGPIEDQCRSPVGVRREVRDVVCHEIAHHFGSNDAELWAIERRRC